MTLDQFTTFLDGPAATLGTRGLENRCRHVNKVEVWSWVLMARDTVL